MRDVVLERNSGPGPWNSVSPLQGFVNKVGAIFNCDTGPDAAVGVTLQRGVFSGSWRGDSESAPWKLAAESEQLHGNSPSPPHDSREATSSEEPMNESFRHPIGVRADPPTVLSTWQNVVAHSGLKFWMPPSSTLHRALESS